MKKILLIGGAGYIGSRFQYEYNNKYEITSLDLELYNKHLFHPNYIGDYGVFPSLKLWNFDIIILLAAYASVHLCKNAPPFNVIKNDIYNFCSLFDNIKKISSTKRIKFIYASTGSIYGNQCDGKDSSETDTVNQPQTMYDLCKKFNDNFALLKSKDVEFYGLRFGTVNGWSPHLRIDIMINAMYQSAKLYKQIVCSCPNSCRGILDIEDLCQAIQVIIDTEEDKRGIYNLASFSSTIGDIARKTAKILDVPVNYKDENTSPYSFKLNCQKILTEFPTLELKGTVESIIKQLDKKTFSQTVRN